MDMFDYAVTTDADYQSGAPPNWEEVDRTESYVLWKRSGPTPFVGVLAEEARPGTGLPLQAARSSASCSTAPGSRSPGRGR